MVVAVNAAIALSDRMAGMWNSTADGINSSRDPVAEVVASTGVTRSQGDWAVHSVLWGVSAMVAVVLLVRARHAAAAIMVFAATGCALELLQNLVTSERSAQAMDVAGNLMGLACGVLVGVVARRFVLGRDPVPAGRHGD